MIELMQDIHEVSLKNGLQDAIIKHTHLLKTGLPKNSEILFLAKNRWFTVVNLTHENRLWIY